jgi:hypothetical protein
MNDRLRNLIRRRPSRIGGGGRVPRRRRHRLPERLTDHRQPLAGGHAADADASILEPGTGAEALS